MQQALQTSLPLFSLLLSFWINDDLQVILKKLLVKLHWVLVNLQCKKGQIDILSYIMTWIFSFHRSAWRRKIYIFFVFKLTESGHVIPPPISQTSGCWFPSTFSPFKLCVISSVSFFCLETEFHGEELLIRKDPTHINPQSFFSATVLKVYLPDSQYYFKTHCRITSQTGISTAIQFFVCLS